MPCDALAENGRSRVPKRLCRPADSMVRGERRHDDRGGARLETTEPAANDTPTRGKGVFYVHTLGCQMNVHDSETHRRRA